MGAGSEARGEFFCKPGRGVRPEHASTKKTRRGGVDVVLAVRVVRAVGGGGWGGGLAGLCRGKKRCGDVVRAVTAVVQRSAMGAEVWRCGGAGGGGGGRGEQKRGPARRH